MQISVLCVIICCKYCFYALCYQFDSSRLNLYITSDINKYMYVFLKFFMPRPTYIFLKCVKLWVPPLLMHYLLSLLEPTFNYFFLCVCTSRVDTYNLDKIWISNWRCKREIDIVSSVFAKPKVIFSR